MHNYTRFERRRCTTTLVSRGEDAKLHSFREEKIHNYTRFELKCSSQVSPLPNGSLITIKGAVSESFYAAREALYGRFTVV
jgi:hypothetical protein